MERYRASGDSAEASAAALMSSRISVTIKSPEELAKKKVFSPSSKELAKPDHNYNFRHCGDMFRPSTVLEVELTVVPYAVGDTLEWAIGINFVPPFFSAHKFHEPDPSKCTDRNDSKNKIKKKRTHSAPAPASPSVTSSDQSWSSSSTGPQVSKFWSHWAGKSASDSMSGSGTSSAFSSNNSTVISSRSTYYKESVGPEPRGTDVHLQIQGPTQTEEEIDPCPELVPPEFRGCLGANTSEATSLASYHWLKEIEQWKRHAGASLFYLLVDIVYMMVEEKFEKYFGYLHKPWERMRWQKPFCRVCRTRFGMYELIFCRALPDLGIF